MSKHLTLNPNNPSPTVQPYLVLHFRGDQDAKEWLIDVDGKIDLYLKDWTIVREAMRTAPEDVSDQLPLIFDWTSQATPLLQDMIKQLAAGNRVVNRLRAYDGSAHPDYVLRNGWFYKWVDVRLEHIPEDLPFSRWPDIADYLPQILNQQTKTE